MLGIPENSVTCFMLYYGRKSLAEEAVESFLRQTHSSKKLIIINNHPDPVYFDENHDNIEVQNLEPEMFKNLNEKYSYALSQIKTKWFCPWDSDDIWLPWHLTNLIENIPNVVGNGFPMKIGMPQTLYSQDNVIKKLGWQMWANCIFENSENLQIDTNSHLNCDRQVIFHNEWNRYWLRLSKYSPSFIFRRFTNERNASMVVGKSGPDYAKRLREKMNSTSIKEPMRPHWDKDYGEDACVFMEKAKKSLFHSDYMLAKTETKEVLK